MAWYHWGGPWLASAHPILFFIFMGLIGQTKIGPSKAAGPPIETLIPF
jgi:hypothetical protein